MVDKKIFDKKIYVKTVYSMMSNRKPDITGYKTKQEAKQAIRTCLWWGVGIVSCKIVKNKR